MEASDKPTEDTNKKSLFPATKTLHITIILLCCLCLINV